MGAVWRGLASSVGERNPVGDSRLPVVGRTARTSLTLVLRRHLAAGGSPLPAFAAPRVLPPSLKGLGHPGLSCPYRHPASASACVGMPNHRGSFLARSPDHPPRFPHPSVAGHAECTAGSVRSAHSGRQQTARSASTIGDLSLRFFHTSPFQLLTSCSASLPFVVDWHPCHRRVSSGGIHDRRAPTALSLRGRSLERASSSAWPWLVNSFDQHTFGRRSQLLRCVPFVLAFVLAQLLLFPCKHPRCR